MKKVKLTLIALIVMVTLVGCSNNSTVNLHDYTHKDPPEFQEEDWLLEYILKGDSYYDK